MGITKLFISLILFGLLVFPLPPVLAAPPPGELDQSQTEENNTTGFYNPLRLAQTFTTGNFTNPETRFLVRVTLKLQKAGSPPDLVVEIRNVGADNLPGNTIYGSATKAADDIGTVFADYDFTFILNQRLSQNTKYAIVCYTLGGDSNNKYRLRQINADGYLAGHYCSYNGTSWSSDINKDFYFKTYVANLESYKEAEHTNVWGTAANPYGNNSQTVYIGGSGFESFTTYHVGYYDAGDTKQASETVTSDTNGILNTSYLCTAHPDATAGTWHAVVYKDPQAPPSTYNANDPDIVLQDEFEVSESAIPEFSTIATSIGIAGICCLIYFLMRKNFSL